MAISNDKSFSGVSYEPYQITRSWQLIPGLGEKQVYVRVMSRSGGISDYVLSIKLISNSSGIEPGNVVENMLTVKADTTSLVTEKPRSNIYFYSDLSLGMRGESVVKLQKILATDKDMYPEGLVTGFFGRLTEKAVIRFQKKNGILCNDKTYCGYVGPKTRKQLFSL